MRIFRIEHKAGHGPYFEAPNGGLNLAYHRLGLPIPCPWERDGQQPAPEMDSGIAHWWNGLSPNVRDEWRFAFRDSEQMLAWVGERDVLLCLREWGYRLAEYECEDRFVRLGTRQVVYNEHRAKRVAIHALA